MKRTPLPRWCRIVRESPATGYEPGAIIRDAGDVVRLVRDRLVTSEQEVFVCVALNGRNRPIGIYEVSRGHATASLVHPRETFRTAIAIGSCAIVLAHNHPSGEPEPSSEDIALTERLKQAGEILGIRVLDHVVVAGDSFRSLAEVRSW